LTKRVRVAVERDEKIVVKMVYYYVHDAQNAAVAVDDPSSIGYERAGVLGLTGENVIPR
jgi:hypothetical protein